MQFVDQCNIHLKAGNGGAGVVAWRREAHYPEGGPWGGDGGKGGDIIIQGDQNLNTLFHLRYKKKICAKNGENGQSKLCSGKKGEDVTIKVPLGTQIFDQNNKLIVDITNENQKYVICQGGKGGHGNAFFKSSTNKAPTLYELGDIGQEINATLKLKHLANVGLVGLPNVGKSSLLSVLTNAKPKIANYEFTTLVPILGTLQNKSKKIVIADIPGLIKGASENKGLGFQFLQHIERCQLLIHVVSLESEDINNAYKNYLIVKNELQKYNLNLSKKEQIIIANKVDLDKNERNLKALKKELKNVEILAVSAKKNINIDKLKSKIFSLCKNNNVKKPNEKATIISTMNNKETDYHFEFKKTGPNEWTIFSKYLSYWLHKIPLNTKDNIYRFNQKLNNCNVDKILKDNGAISKDTIILDGIEFEVD